ncbi:MAG TPA: DUF4112 domain-containing protein [Cyanobacteria bacterium UBA8543]|nr:DUF4112 domain-containing protein [Cyanobacteria bacterium UBA8543]
MSQLPSQPSHQPTSNQVSTLRRLRQMSHLLDNAIRIPGTPYRIGIDPLLDVLPVGGDFLGTAFSIYIVVEATRLGMPRSALVQMVLNIIFDTVIGAVPVLGTVVDATWKANVKNIELLEEHLDVPPQPKQKASWLFLALLLGGLLLVVVIMAAISVMLLRWLWSLIAG